MQSVTLFKQSLHCFLPQKHMEREVVPEGMENYLH